MQRGEGGGAGQHTSLSAAEEERNWGRWRWASQPGLAGLDGRGTLMPITRRMRQEAAEIYEK